MLTAMTPFLSPPSCSVFFYPAMTWTCQVPPSRRGFFSHCQLNGYSTLTGSPPPLSVPFRVAPLLLRSLPCRAPMI